MRQSQTCIEQQGIFTPVHSSMKTIAWILFIFAEYILLSDVQSGVSIEIDLWGDKSSHQFKLGILKFI